MSYTTISLIKKHVIAPVTEPLSTVALIIQPSGSAWSTLSGGPLQNGSVVVASLTRDTPLSEPLTFGASQSQSAQFPIDQGSIILASDSSLGTQYIENVDYTVDYQTGAIQAISSGAISSSASVHLWYFPLTLYSEGVDYDIDYTLGNLRRLAAGTIVDSQTLQVTFMPVTQTLDDAIFAEAVSEANQFISAAVDPDEDFGADLNLQTAATYLGAAIVCRAASALSLATASDSKNASMWLALAENFRQDSATALDRFRPPRKNLTGPKSV